MDGMAGGRQTSLARHGTARGLQMTAKARCVGSADSSGTSAIWDGRRGPWGSRNR